ncbi:hypothetical protein ACFLR4_00875 [Bacteroidota bacterium]
MNDKLIIMLERKLNNELSAEEEIEFAGLLEENEDLQNEYNEQKKVKEVLKKMTLTNPSKEMWDRYWMNVYNRIERKFAWLVILIGSTMLLGFAALQVIEKLFADTQTPAIIKYGMFILVFGFLILIFSVIREKFSASKKDKYKEIQR